jgi:mannose-1-phosphate guanylyltransferase/mannose-6-phosphate isomerase
VLCVFPADHVIQNVAEFHVKLASAIALAENGFIVTFGIKPHYPETGYGYIEGEDELIEKALRVKRFVEKPDAKTAAGYVQSGVFFWNSGMFAFKASVMIKELGIHQPELLHAMKQLMACHESEFGKAYERLPSISIDVAVMERTDKAAVLPSDFGWSDIGSWNSLHAFLPKDADSNVIDGDVIAKNAKNSLLMGYERLIAANNIHDLVVVETPDAVFVSDMESSRDVKAIVEVLKAQGREEFRKHKTVHHPWGTFTVLEQEDGFRVARYAIDYGASLEIKTDIHACTYVIVIKGSVKAGQKNLETGEFFMLQKGESVVLKNTGRLTLTLAEISLQKAP